MPVVPITSTPYPVAPNNSYNGFTVQNQGATTLYFSQYNTINPSGNIYDYSVLPGGLINWPAEETCWVACLDGEEGSASYAPLTVDQSGSVSGTVSLGAGSTVGIVGTVDTKSPTQPVILQSIPYHSTGVIGGYLIIGGIVTDVSAYSSVLLTITGGNNVVTLSPLNYYVADISWVDTNGVGISNFNPQWLYDSGMNASLALPVVASHLFITLSLEIGVTTQAEDLVINLYGLNESISAPAYISSSHLLSDGTPAVTGGGIPVGNIASISVTGSQGSVIAAIGSKNGPATLAVYRANAVQTVSELWCFYNGALVGLDGIFSAATAPVFSTAPIAFILPMLPIQLSCFNQTAGGASFITTLLQ